MTGQLTPAGLVAKYGLQDESMRELFTSYLAERAAELDYASLVGMANTLCGNFWRDLEQHHPGICSLRLGTESPPPGRKGSGSSPTTTGGGSATGPTSAASC
jgi:hypothetical protein